MAPGTSPETFAELSAVHEWFRAEQNVLRAAIAQSEVQGFDRQTWQLVWIGFDLIDRIGPWRDWLWDDLNLQLVRRTTLCRCAMPSRFCFSCQSECCSIQKA